VKNHGWMMNRAKQIRAAAGRGTTLTVGTPCQEEESEHCMRSGRITLYKLEYHRRDSPLKSPTSIFTLRVFSGTFERHPSLSLSGTLFPSATTFEQLQVGL
jgi:hypothetical protein